MTRTRVAVNFEAAFRSFDEDGDGDISAEEFQKGLESLGIDLQGIRKVRDSTLVERSLAINANSTRAWSTSGTLHCILGEPVRAIADAERAIRLSPLDPSMWVPYGLLAIAHMQLSHYEEAASWAKKSVTQHRYNLPAYHVLAASCAILDRRTDAEQAINQLLELDPELTITRLQQIYPVARYPNLDVFLDGLRRAGLPE